MSMIYCHRGGHYIDTDLQETVVIDNEEICSECATNEEVALLERLVEAGTKIRSHATSEVYELLGSYDPDTDDRDATVKIAPLGQISIPIVVLVDRMKEDFTIV